MTRVVSALGGVAVAAWFIRHTRQRQVDPDVRLARARLRLVDDWYAEAGT